MPTEAALKCVEMGFELLHGSFKWKSAYLE
jgi:hypothetical protein